MDTKARVSKSPEPTAPSFEDMSNLDNPTLFQDTSMIQLRDLLTGLLRNKGDQMRRTSEMKNLVTDVFSHRVLEGVAPPSMQHT